MSRLPGTGVCILSIDVDSHAPRVDDLRLRLAEAGIPVTWGIDVAQAADVGRHVSPHSGDEVSLLADTTWAGEGASRRRFADRLRHDLAQFAALGLCPTTLVLPNGRLAPHDELLVKHGIRMVRVSQGRQSVRSRGWWPTFRATVQGPACGALRWGLWEVVAGCEVSKAGVRRAQRIVDRLVRQGGFAVVVASSERLASNHGSTENLISHLRRRKTEGAVRFETLASMSARWQATRPMATARSILRSAAA